MTIIEVGSNRLRIQPKLPTDVLAALRKALAYRPYGYVFMPSFQMGKWDGYINLFNTTTQEAPAGCYWRVHTTLEKLGMESDITYAQQMEPRGKIEARGLDLKDFQIEAIEKSVAKRFCIISAPVRAGKTAVIGGILNYIDHYPAWVITKGIDLVRQTTSDIGGYTGKNIGAFSESLFEDADIVVSSYQALASWANGKSNVDLHSEDLSRRNEQILEAVRSAKVLILDESHHALSDKSKKFIREFRNIGYKIGLSGTPKPDNMPVLAVEAAVGPIAFKVKFNTLIKAGRIAQPVVVLYNLPSTWFIQYSTDYAELYEANIVNNENRNKWIAILVEELKNQGKTAFVIVSRLPHGKILRDLIPGSIFVSGALNGDMRKGVYEALKEKKLSCIIATVGKEGLNLPSLDVVINAEGLSGEVTTTQKMRSLTAHEGKACGIVLELHKHIILKHILL